LLCRCNLASRIVIANLGRVPNDPSGMADRSSRHRPPGTQRLEVEAMGQTNVNVPSDGSSGMGAGMIVGLVLALVVIGFVVWYFVSQGGGGSPAPSHSVIPSLPLPTAVPTAMPSAVRAYLVG
jgi:hypothetical protein